MTELEMAYTIKDMPELEGKVSKNRIKIILEAYRNLIAEQLKNGEKFNFYGLGTLKPIIRKASKGRNLHTGESLDIPEQKSISWKTSKKFRKEMNA